MLSVSPARQRQGLGGRLMREAIAESERHGVPAYLWTAKPENVPYYHSHGYRVFDEAKIVRGVNNWFMLRQPGASGQA
jgi:predicted N-acetyltransferase YhbS